MYKIIDIYWQRVNLHLKLNKNITNKVYLKSKKESFILPYQNDEIIINITNTPEQQMLRSGIWEITIEDSSLTISKELISLLDDKSRIFPYRSGFYAYLVSFSIDNNLILKIKTDFMMKNKKPTKYNRLKEAKNIDELLKIIAQKIGIKVFQIFYYLLYIFSFHKNILFLSENDLKLNGNLKYLYDYLTSNYKKYKAKVYTVNRFKKKNSIISYIKELYYIANSKVIFIDNYTPLLTHINLSKKTKLIQLWHAGIGFKSVGYARFGLQDSPHPYQSSHRKYTNAIVNSDELIDIYQEVFGCKKEIILPIGIPRLDNFLSKEKIEKICKKLYNMNPLLETHQVILFSPTFRGEGNKNAYYDYSKIDLKLINEYCKKNNALFLIKMHPFISKKIEIPEEYKDTIFDYSNLDINNLIYISDIMITDYSSCAYEFSLFHRPIIYYRYDKDIYEYNRPIHTNQTIFEMDYIATDFKEVMNFLNEINIDIHNRFKNINESYKVNSSKEIIERCIGEL